MAFLSSYTGNYKGSFPKVEP